MAVARTPPETCTYQSTTWSTTRRTVVDARTVRKPYGKLGKDEVDPGGTGCTVCEEDQELVELPGLEPMRVCWRLAPKVREILAGLIERGEPIRELRGYKVIRSRGAIDAKGNRTGFSNHSFGAAVDINRSLNGLYDGCVNWGPKCRLNQGGKWRPGTPGTLTADSAIVKAMKEAGFRWGGEIAGTQKDFMHFSPTGY